MLTLISYATDNMSKSQANLHLSFQKFHPDGDNIAYAPHAIYSLDPTFWNFNHEILRQERGAGYWFWKPLIIYKTLLKLAAGDHLLYCDAGITVLRDVEPLVDLNRDILLFNNEWRHIDWCKMDVMNAITPGWANIDRPDQQVQASCILIKKTADTLAIVKEWLTWCMVPGFITDQESRMANLPGFREHRHDQAILTCLAIYYGIQRHWCPFDWNKGNKHKYPEDDYPVIFEHHRRRNPGTGKVIDFNGDEREPEWGS